MNGEDVVFANPAKCMRLILSVFALIGVGATTGSAGLFVTASAQEGMLHWTSGDSLSGDLMAADEKSVVWQSNLFSEPLSLIWQPWPVSVIRNRMFDRIPPICFEFRW